MARALRFSIVLVSLATLNACSYLPSWDFAVGRPKTVAQQSKTPDPNAPKQAALETRQFDPVPPQQEILGDVQVLFAHHDNTFSGFAREHNLGYDELRHANPAVDPWLPGAGTPVFLPTMYIVPVAPRDGIVINLPAMRLLYFSNSKTNPNDESEAAVLSHPIGIGREGWSTPTGVTKVTYKAHAPTWYPPASVRAEHAALGDPLPSIVPPGPDNPLGDHTLKLSMPGYLIHGTNKPAGVGMRVSHGCIRLYPEDIASLFDRVPKNTPVYIVDQPVLVGWRDGELYLEVHQPLVEDKRDITLMAHRIIAQALKRKGLSEQQLDEQAIAKIVSERRGIPFPVNGSERYIEGYLANARVIKNDIALDTTNTTASR